MLNKLRIGPKRLLAPGLVAAGVDRKVRALEKTSDHAPVWVEIDRSVLQGSGR